MRIYLSLLIATLPFSFLPALAQPEAEGVITVLSAAEFEATSENLQRLLDERGFKVIAKVDHAENASRVGKELKPTLLILFGKPEAGTQLMSRERLVALDLPQKALVWEAENGSTYISYNTARYISSRHGISESDQTVQQIDEGLGSLFDQLGHVPSSSAGAAGGRPPEAPSGLIVIGN